MYNWSPKASSLTKQHGRNVRHLFWQIILVLLTWSCASLHLLLAVASSILFAQALTSAQSLTKRRFQNLQNFQKVSWFQVATLLLFLHFYAYHEWNSVFLKVWYDVMSYPYVIMFESDSISKRNTSVLRQSSSLFALTAYLPGRKGRACNSNFNTRFHLIYCTNSRNLAGMYNVQQTMTKLCLPGTKFPFHPRELLVYMLAVLIYLFTLQGGSVLAPLCGTMTSLIASVKIVCNRTAI